MWAADGVVVWASTRVGIESLEWKYMWDCLWIVMICQIRIGFEMMMSGQGWIGSCQLTIGLDLASGQDCIHPQVDHPQLWMSFRDLID